MYTSLDEKELESINGGVSVGTIGLGVVTVVGGVIGVAIPDPLTTAAGYVGIAAGVTIIGAGIVG